MEGGSSGAPPLPLARWSRRAAAQAWRCGPRQCRHCGGAPLPRAPPPACGYLLLRRGCALSPGACARFRSRQRAHGRQADPSSPVLLRAPPTSLVADPSSPTADSASPVADPASPVADPSSTAAWISHPTAAARTR
jgi:hypothetical protein